MYSFKNDYSEGMHINILNRLHETNMVQAEGYTEDMYTENAVKRIKEFTGDHVDVHLISGGTQTNLLAISSFLRPHEACISADSGHINVHETGAIEATGHKVITVTSDDGKVKPHQVIDQVKYHADEHMVKPRLVYISNPTEVGTTYSKEELTALNKVCKDNDLLLYLDGARLATAIVSSDVTLKDLAELTDAFFIGGTKNGAILGEAFIISNPNLKRDMRYLIKQRGALLAKGRLLGIQFDELFKDELIFKLAAYANQEAMRMKEAFIQAGHKLYTDSNTNQIFPILNMTLIKKLEEHFSFYIWDQIDEDYAAIRLVTSWATDQSQVDKLIEIIKEG
ncbi:aminotransferase class I/II-fold pyridoxal phosphate-dependent enzyme [Acidaminobacter sp. JC074]|uniref:threonine aldolase family protein n=1 Tax=Acidaminobacter sp. JC074 TaxID=2530199 RepID=UPI001F0DB16C|nr:aminotransferase class I/II-fold pyridoxal phosphate-dependent enzyme [Acidaminobacter sp. JC074]MCH4886771.1 aminotransferase class I/II-fold pyridoxal phosphate-dependent enzyme [Acidaminobacter sp. JC074]